MNYILLLRKTPHVSTFYGAQKRRLPDAIGKTIHKIGMAQKRTGGDYRAEKVLFVIITDGLENASRAYSSDQVKAQIERQKKEYDWEFFFLGANIDAAETAKRFGIAPDRAQNYHADAEGVELSFRVMSDAAASFRTCAAMPKEWNREIEQDYRKRGGKDRSAAKRTLHI